MSLRSTRSSPIVVCSQRRLEFALSPRSFVTIPICCRRSALWSVCPAVMCGAGAGADAGGARFSALCYDARLLWCSQSECLSLLMLLLLRCMLPVFSLRAQVDSVVGAKRSLEGTQLSAFADTKKSKLSPPLQKLAEVDPIGNSLRYALPTHTLPRYHSFALHYATHIHTHTHTPTQAFTHTHNTHIHTITGRIRGQLPHRA
jgi:hypothetical protein